MSAQLHFVFGKKEYLVLQYGMATFDGCGGENAKPTRVGHHPAVMSAFGHWGEVIWPATMDHLQGRYGLSGTFFPRELIRLADSMAAALQSGGRSARISSGAADVGC